MTPAPRVVALTGAGVSAESGLSTFRDQGGLWARFDPLKLATPEAFARDPDRVQAFYDARRKAALAASPNPAHLALARLQAELTTRGGLLTLVTQNVDDLHERAGSAQILHMHGELLKARCTGCAAIIAWREDLGVVNSCPECGKTGTLRPHVVWFGEMPLHLGEIEDALANADLFVAIGTSGSVYPAAGLVGSARARGVRACELNLEPSDNSDLFHERRYGLATTIVPAWVDKVLGQYQIVPTVLA